MLFKLEITKDKFPKWSTLLCGLPQDCEFADLCNRMLITTETNQYSVDQPCIINIQLFLDKKHIKKLNKSIKISYWITSFLAGFVWLFSGCDNQVFTETKIAFEDQQIVKAANDPDNVPCEILQLKGQSAHRLHKTIARILRSHK